MENNDKTAAKMMDCSNIWPFNTMLVDLNCNTLFFYFKDNEKRHTMRQRKPYVDGLLYLPQALQQIYPFHQNLKIVNFSM